MEKGRRQVLVVIGVLIVTIAALIRNYPLLVHDVKPVSAQTPSPTPGQSWYMAGANPQRTSWVSEEVTGNLKPEWFTHLPAYISQKTQPITVNGRIYIAAADGLHAYDATDGHEQWHYQTTMPLSNSPTVINGIAYIAGFDRKIRAINAITGQQIWESDSAEAGFQTNPIILNDRIYAGNRDGKVYAFTMSGAIAWTFDTGGPISQSAAYKNGVIYQASNSMYAFAINAATGEQIWKSQKFPGQGFYSYWPVVYTHTDGQDYVIFNSIYPFGNITHEASDDLYQPLGVYPVNIGPLGVEPGPWPTGTETINASRASQYYNEYPYRRTYFVLNARTGQEFTYNFGSGTGGAPISYAGGDNGTQYPPLISPQGALYQRSSHEGLEGIPRGTITGWKFGTSILSIPSGTFAIDEPTGQSGGGNLIYYRMMGDRGAGSFDISSPQKDQTLYFHQGSFLARRIPELFTTGWPYAYWKHADQSPPIPYRNRVYMIANNALVAFSVNGRDQIDTAIWNQMLPSNTGVLGNQLELDKLASPPGNAVTITGLYTNLTTANTSWPKMLQQETYYVIAPGRDRTKYFVPLEIGASAGFPTFLTSDTSSRQTKILTHQYNNGVLTTYLSSRTPVVLAHNTGTSYHLNGSFQKTAYQSSSGIQHINIDNTIDGSQMQEGWLLFWDNSDTHRWFPLVVSLQRRPSSINLTADGIVITYPGAAGYLAITPFKGMSAPLPGQGPTYSQDRSNTILTQWNTSLPLADVNQVQLLDRLARHFPVQWTEQITLDAAQNAILTTDYTNGINFGGSQNDWNSQGNTLAIIPHSSALAAWNSSPITINNQPLTAHQDANYVLPLGRLAFVNNTNTITVNIPRAATYWSNEIVIPPVTPNHLVANLLSQQVQQMITAGHLRPYHIDHGALNAGSNRTQGEMLFDYFHNPADTIETVVSALPFLPTSLQQTARSYIQSEYQQYSPETYVHIGFSGGTSRADHELLPDQEVSYENYRLARQTQTTWPINTGWNFTPSNFYSLYLYAREFGNAATIFSNTQNKLEDPFGQDRFQTSMPYVLNHYLKGHIGYLRLAHLANQDNHQNTHAARDRLIKLLLLRLALDKYPDALTQSNFEYSGYRWIVQQYRPESTGEITFARVQNGTIWSQYELYGFSYDPAYLRSGAMIGGAYSFTTDFHQLTPELGAFLRDFARTEITKRVLDYQKAAPNWFVSKTEEGAGEYTLQTLHDTIGLFKAKAFILNASKTELDAYLDVPAVKKGDLFYIQKLITAINVPSDPSYTPPPTQPVTPTIPTSPTPTPTTPVPTHTPIPGDLDHSGQVGVGDLNGLLSAFGSTNNPLDPSYSRYNLLADLDGSGAIGVIDLNGLLARFGR